MINRISLISAALGVSLFIMLGVGFYSRGKALELSSEQLKTIATQKALCEANTNTLLSDLARQNGRVEAMRLEVEHSKEAIDKTKKEMTKKYTVKVKSNSSCETKLSQIDALHRLFYEARTERIELKR